MTPGHVLEQLVMPKCLLQVRGQWAKAGWGRWGVKSFLQACPSEFPWRRPSGEVKGLLDMQV